MYLMKAVTHNQHSSGSKYCLSRCAELHEPLASPISPNTPRKKRKERNLRPADSHPCQQILLHNLHWNVYLRLEIRIRVHHGRERYRSGLGHVLEFQKVEEIHIGPSSYSLLSTKKSKTRKERHTLQAKSTFHPYPSLAPSQSPRS